MTNYIAVLHKNGRKGYGVVFPDFPGCVAVGKTYEDAIRDAAEALAFHVDGMRQDKIHVPTARTLEQIQAAKLEWLDWTNSIIAYVPLLPPQGRTQRIQVSMDELLVSQIDAVTKNRSAFLAEAARRALS